MSFTCKVESGLQLMARLSRKREIDKFYHQLFESGPKLGEVVEIFGGCGAGKTILVMDLIVQALLPTVLGGAETDVLIYHTDGNLNIQLLLYMLKETIQCRFEDSAGACVENKEMVFMACCNRFHFLEIYDATQLYVTIHNLENFFIDHPNISMLIFDTLTAYYWSEQGSHLTKMDLYLKNMLKLIQKVTKDYKSIIVYTRQEYFNSSKENIKHLEAYHKSSTLECLNYSIYVSFEDSRHQVTIRSSDDSVVTKVFRINNGQLEWI